MNEQSFKPVSLNGVRFHDESEQFGLFGVDFFERWYHIFDGKFESPIGRKMIYAIADYEELRLRLENPKRSSIIFRNRWQAYINQRWSNLGVGRFDTRSGIIFSLAHELICLGFALSHHEYNNRVRYSFQWRQTNENTILVDWTENQPYTRPPHALQGKESLDGPHHIDVQLERQGSKFFCSHEQVFFFPIGIYPHLVNTLNGRILTNTTQSNPSLRWLGGEDQINAEICRSTIEAFMATQKPIFILDELQFVLLLEVELTSRGLGSFTILQFDIQDQSCELKIMSDMPGFTIGFLIGFWERGFGGSFVSQISRIDEHFLVKISKIPIDYENIG